MCLMLHCLSPLLNFAILFYPRRYLKTRTILKVPLSVPPVLVKWQHLDDSLATWEVANEMKHTILGKLLMRIMLF